MALRAAKIAQNYDQIRVKFLSAAIDELCNQGWDEWEDAQAELNELLACVKRCEAEVEDLEKEVADNSVFSAEEPETKKIKPDLV